VIDVAELERVYGPLVTPDTVSPKRKGVHSATPDIVTLLQAHIWRFGQEMDLLRQERDAERQARERERDEHCGERERLHNMLEKRCICYPSPKQRPGRRQSVQGSNDGRSADAGPPPCIHPRFNSRPENQESARSDLLLA
jgi:hypothetical protein